MITVDMTAKINFYKVLNQSERNAKLRKASADGLLEEMQALLKAGADINNRDEDGWTPLVFCVYSSNTRGAGFLIEKGADIKTPFSYGKSPFNLALILQHTDVARLILSLMTPKERYDYLHFKPENCTFSKNFINEFNIELKNNAKKIYDILRPAWRIGTNSLFNDLAFFPKEIVWTIRILEASIQDFPDWYKNRMPSDLALTIRFFEENKKRPALIFSNLKGKKENNLSELQKDLEQQLNLNDKPDNSPAQSDSYSSCFL